MGSTQGARRPMVIAVVAIVASVMVMAAPVGADIVIEFDELIFGDVGAVETVAEADVPDELVGRICEISVLAENQASVHLGNDVIVSTGTSQAVIVGVEDEANGGTNETYDVVMGSTILVELRFGPDGMSSLGFSLAFDCAEPVTTTTTSTTVAPALDGGDLTATSSTTVPPTTPPTTAPAIAVPESTTTTTAADGIELPDAPVATPVVAAPAYTG